MSKDRESRIERLRTAAHRKHEEATARANQAIIRLNARGAVLNFNTVAAEAKVSKDFLYSHRDLRRTIMTARAARPASLAGSPTERASSASAVVKLAVASEALTQIRAENAQLRTENARLLGELLALRRSDSLARPR